MAPVRRRSQAKAAFLGFSMAGLRSWTGIRVRLRAGRVNPPWPGEAPLTGGPSEMPGDRVNCDFGDPLRPASRSTSPKGEELQYLNCSPAGELPAKRGEGAC